MSLVSSIFGSHQISKAVGAQTSSLQSAVDSTNGLYSDATSLLQPYVNTGTSGVNSLMSALQPGGDLSSTFSWDPSQLTSDPGYQFTLSQGLQATQRAAAANGTLNSGGTEKALAQYASGVASQYENQDFNMALQKYLTNRNAAVQNVTLPLSIGQQAASQTANLDVGKAGTLNTLMEGIGNAKAAGSIAQSNLWSNLLNGGMITSAIKPIWNAIPGDNTLTSAVGSLLGV